MSTHPERHGVTSLHIDWIVSKGINNNGLKLSGHRFNGGMGKHNFVNRVVNEWNKLPAEAFKYSTVHSFKIHLDKHLRDDCRTFAHRAFARRAFARWAFARPGS